MHREGSCTVKRPGVLSKVQMLTLVLGVGVFSLLPKRDRGRDRSQKRERERERDRENGRKRKK